MTVDEDMQPDDLVLTELLRLNVAISGIVTGLVAGLGIFIATNWLVLKGGPQVGAHLSLLGQYFIGYEVTFGGSLVGFAYAFICGFLIACLIAKLYNAMVDIRDSRRIKRSP